MSQPFIIKCIKCKGDFDEKESTYRRICPSCVKQEKENKRKELVQERKRNHISEHIINCKFCKNDFISKTPQKMYCSNTCRSKFWTIPKDIKRTEEHIDRLILKIEHLRSLVD